MPPRSRKDAAEQPRQDYAVHGLPPAMGDDKDALRAELVEYATTAPGGAPTGFTVPDDAKVSFEVLDDPSYFDGKVGVGHIEVIPLPAEGP